MKLDPILLKPTFAFLLCFGRLESTQLGWLCYVVMPPNGSIQFEKQIHTMYVLLLFQDCRFTSECLHQIWEVISW